MTILEQQVLALLRDGHGKGAVAQHLGISRPKVQRIARKYAAQAVAPQAGTTPLDRTVKLTADAQDVDVKVPRLIRTEAEALAAAEIDLNVWEPVGVEIRAYPIPMGDGRIEQGSYVKVRCRKRSLSMNPERIVEAVTRGLESALSAKVVTPRAVVRHSRPQVLRTRIITDLHFGGYAWSKSTGSPSWDIGTATATANACNRYLDAQVPEDTTETLLAFLGDLFHFDTPKGTTTGGTQLDIDSRVDLMLAAVSDYAVTTVSEEAEKRPVTVLMVPGNHDDILSRALRRMLLIVFAKHKNVTVLEQFTKRQYHRYGNTLLGFTHGDGQRQRLVDAMAVECGRLGMWDGATCRELHLGHVHHESSKQKVIMGTESLQGTVVRTHLALTSTDQYHADEGWVGNPTGMSDLYYAHQGAMIGSRVASPLLLDAA